MKIFTKKGLKRYRSEQYASGFLAAVEALIIAIKGHDRVILGNYSIFNDGEYKNSPITMIGVGQSIYNGQFNMSGKKSSAPAIHISTDSPKG